MRGGLPISAALTVALLAGCDAGESDPAPKVNVPVRPQVIVLAGDSLVVDGKSYHLADSATPQPAPAARCWAEAVAGKQTRLWVKEKIQQAETIQVTPTGGMDDLGRAYATVSLDGIDLGQQLVQEGFVATPKNGEFRWCEPTSSEREGAPDILALITPVG